MKICAAQIKPVAGDIAKNIATHKTLIRRAIVCGADCIVFPELSLTGYEPELAKSLAITQNDKVLDDFEQLSNSKTISIAVGMPVKTSGGLCIGLLVFQPSTPRQTYYKQYLHEDERAYFITGHNRIVLNTRGECIVPAICYESLLPHHALEAHQLGATIYMASVAKSAPGIQKAFQHYPEIAVQYSMTVIMANCIGRCDTFESAGSSAVWNTRGELVGQLDEENEGLIVFDTKTGELTTEIIIR